MLNSKSKIGTMKLKILDFVSANDNGLGFKELASKFESHPLKTQEQGKKRIPKLNLRKRDYDWVSASVPTVSKALTELQEEGLIQRDPRTKKYKITAKGKQYAKLSEIVDYIVSSIAVDSVFDWSMPKEKEEVEEVSAAYMLVTAKKDGAHGLALLHERLKRTQPMLWEIDVVNYAIETRMLNVEGFEKAVKGRASIQELEELQKKLRMIWKRLFKDVERLTVVETVRPQLLLEKLERKLQESNGLLRTQNL
jgi:hypothetical protein